MPKKKVSYSWHLETFWHLIKGVTWKTNVVKVFSNKCFHGWKKKVKRVFYNRIQESHSKMTMRKLTDHTKWIKKVLLFQRDKKN